MLLYRIADPGEGFDIERLAHAAISNPDGNPLQHAFVREEKGLRPGGLGLAITRSLVDELIYNEARNEVVFVKYLDQRFRVFRGNAGPTSAVYRPSPCSQFTRT